MRTPFTMVLDHVEVIDHPSCRDAIAELVVSLPVGSRLALGSRTEPPIRMAQLRAQGRVEEVTAEDLAMGRDEAQALLTAAGVDVDVATSTSSSTRPRAGRSGSTSGPWPSRATGATPSGVSIRGDDRVVADYLRAEVHVVPLPGARVVPGPHIRAGAAERPPL